MRTLLIGVAMTCAAAIALGVGVCWHDRPATEALASSATEDVLGDADSVVNSIGMRFVRIPAGKFMMGSPETEVYRNDDETQHEVSLSKAYYLGVFEVTQGQFEKVMGSNPSFFSANGGGKQRVAGKSTADYPVERVTWSEALAFCKKLSDKERKTYRLPTEAEWEYACRAGTTTVFHTGDRFNSNFANINGLSYSSYGEETSGPFHRATVKVGEYKLAANAKGKNNAFGLFDMHGNVQEWCADWYAPDYYQKSVNEDPRGPKSGTERILRGGAWPSSAKACRCAARNRLDPDERSWTNGFRVVLEAK